MEDNQCLHQGEINRTNHQHDDYARIYKYDEECAQCGTKLGTWDNGVFIPYQPEKVEEDGQEEI